MLWAQDHQGQDLPLLIRKILRNGYWILKTHLCWLKMKANKKSHNSFEQSCMYSQHFTAVARIEEPCWTPMKWLLGSSQGWWWLGGSVLNRSKLQTVKNYNTVYFSTMEHSTSIEQQRNPNRLFIGRLPLTRALSRGAVGHSEFPCALVPCSVWVCQLCLSKWMLRVA